MKLNIKKITILVIGIVLFILFSFLKLQVLILAFLSVLFGPLSGIFIGILGQALSDALQQGNIYWSWAIAYGVLGFLIGLFYFQYNSEKNIFDKKSMIIFNVIQIISNIISYLVIAPSFDIIVYSKPIIKSYLNGIITMSLNIIIVSLIVTPLLFIYSKKISKSN